MAGDTHLPTGIDPNQPSAARIYDAFLGGTHNFAADRAVAERAVQLVPDLPRIMKANRGFLQRAVRYALSRGVRQFLDLGSGIPTEGNVHEVARELHPDARVAYVDREPTAVLHAREIIGLDPGTIAIQGDLQQPADIMSDPQLRQLIDFAEPVCVLMLAVLHFVPDSPALTAALRHYHEVAAPGSILVISHATASANAEELDRITDLYNRTGTPLVIRDRDRFGGLLEGWDLVEPGIVYGPEWRPEPGDEWDGDPSSSITIAAVGVHR
ncbi:SAM-dependent methyltransferase [Actinoplanes sp. NPDC051475]|uniref:SAM-dependent methyltransferase n=1 Tax=Actinoplanes sp. NPDC051475 TaxID=3157225 RepID=UPI0034501256